jgi:hypothetical protein
LARELARLLPTSVPSVLAFQQLRDALSMSQKQLDAALLPRGGTLAALKLSAGSTLKVVHERLARFEKPKGPSIIFILGSEHAGKRVLFDVLSVYLIIVAAITVLSTRPKHRSIGATEILGHISDLGFATGGHGGTGTWGALQLRDIQRVLDACKDPAADVVIYGLLRLAPYARQALDECVLFHDSIIPHGALLSLSPSREDRINFASSVTTRSIVIPSSEVHCFLTGLVIMARITLTRRNALAIASGQRSIYACARHGTAQDAATSTLTMELAVAGSDCAESAIAKEVCEEVAQQGKGRTESLQPINCGCGCRYAVLVPSITDSASIHGGSSLSPLVLLSVFNDYFDATELHNGHIPGDEQSEMHLPSHANITDRRGGLSGKSASCGGLSMGAIDEFNTEMSQTDPTRAIELLMGSHSPPPTINMDGVVPGSPFRNMTRRSQHKVSVIASNDPSAASASTMCTRCGSAVTTMDFASAGSNSVHACCDILSALIPVVLASSVDADSDSVSILALAAGAVGSSSVAACNSASVQPTQSRRQRRPPPRLDMFEHELSVNHCPVAEAGSSSTSSPSVAASAIMTSESSCVAVSQLDLAIVYSANRYSMTKEQLHNYNSAKREAVRAYIKVPRDVLIAMNEYRLSPDFVTHLEYNEDTGGQTLSLLHFICMPVYLLLLLQKNPALLTTLNFDLTHGLFRTGNLNAGWLW